MNKLLFAAIAVFLITCFSSCAVIGGIFKAGVWVGVLAVVGIVAVIVLIVSRSSKK